ncbi:MAG TPA: Ig-like domain-containing protein, partial [Pirellulales bacterium]|nr:Ig-like domain-containing protein [Pirellulales bacterium]
MFTWPFHHRPKANRTSRLPRRKLLAICPEALEPRMLLAIMAQADNYTSGNVASLVVSAANGVQANDVDYGGYQMTSHLSAGPSHGSATLNADGSFTYTATAGFYGSDSFSYYDTDAHGSTSQTVNVSILVNYGVLSAVDATKLAVDTVHVPLQILGSASGQPATAQNLSIVYDSGTGVPDQVVEGNFQLSMSPFVSDYLSAQTSFDGSTPSFSYITTQNLSGSNPTVHVAQQVSTSTYATGRYPYTMTVSGSKMYGSSTITAAVNVDNESANPIGNGWQMPGVYHLTSNNVTGIPAGVVLTTGDGRGAYYFTQGSGNSYTSPAGAFAFSTLTSVTGGGWQLVDQHGVTHNFNSSGNLTSVVLPNTQTTTYTWTNGLLTSITDPYSRSVALAYTSNKLSTITDFAGNVWSFAHTNSLLTSVTLPNPGGGAPIWQYGYTGNLLSGVTDPMSNVTSVSYDSYDRESGATLPGGATTSATSEQHFGYGSTNLSSPANATTAAQVNPNFTDALTHASDYTTDVFGNITSFVDANGNTTTVARNSNGLVTTLTQPSPDGIQQPPVTTYSYDLLGNETSASGALSTFGTYTYNSFSEPTQFVNSLNKTWTWTYDSHENLASQTDALSNTISYTVDSYGNPLTMVQPAPNNATGTITTSYTYDSDERLTK